MTEVTEPEYHLYRWYDEDGLLLYVGMTRDLKARTRTHWQSSWWTQWAVVVDVRPEDSGTKGEVAERELSAIASERPLFNSLASPGARWRAAGYLLERGMDPIDHADQLPAHTRTRHDVTNVGKTARRTQPITTAERLTRGQVNPNWPAPLTKQRATVPATVPADHEADLAPDLAASGLDELADRYWDMWAAYGRGEGVIPPRWMHGRLVEAGVVYGVRLVERVGKRVRWTGPHPDMPGFDQRDKNALLRHHLVMMRDEPGQAEILLRRAGVSVPPA